MVQHAARQGPNKCWTGRVMMMNSKIFIGSILLEKNRWTSRIPSYKVSEWLERFKKDGFDGIELWENHMLLADESEQKILKESAAPVAVYNTYVDFDHQANSQRIQVAQIICDLKAQGVKYNFGNDLTQLETYIQNLKEWARLLPDSCRILCECHGGTVMEVPSRAAEVFAELKDSRFQAIVHCMADAQMLEEWFKYLGERITHAHVSLRNSEEKCVMLKDNPAYVRQCLDIMKNAGYNGTYTLEFTEGVRAPGENIDGLYQAGLEDLRFLREALA